MNVNTLNTDEEVIGFMTVTPEVAQKWLGLNTSNRKLKKGNISAFAADMRDGRWENNGEAIKFAGPPAAPTKLLDGQNRLHAILKAGVPVRLAVAFNIKPKAQGTMDSGAKRTAADNLAIGGVPNAHIVAAAAAITFRVGGGGQFRSGTLGVTNAAIQERIEEMPALVKSAKIASTYAVRAETPPSVVAYTHYMMAALDEAEATAFWRDMAEGIGLGAGDPVIALRSRLAQARRQREKVDQGALIAAIFRTWNTRREGRAVTRVQISTGGDIPRLK